MLQNNKTWGIDLTGRRMQYEPWAIDKNGKYRNPSKKEIQEIYSISGSALAETIEYFEQCGGEFNKLALMLNEHIVNEKYEINIDELKDKSRFYNHEYYFYFQMFCKKIIGRYDWHFGEKSNEQLSQDHRIWEKGFMSFIPWGMDENGNEVHDVSIVPNLIIILYFEEKLKLDPYDFYLFVNASLIGQNAVNRDFYINPMKWCSAEFIDYGFEFSKILTNDSNIIEKASYYIGTKSQNLSIRSLFFSIPGKLNASSFDFAINKSDNIFNHNIETKKRYLKLVMTYKNKFNKNQYLKYGLSSIINVVNTFKGSFRATFSKIFDIKKPIAASKFNNDYTNPYIIIECKGSLFNPWLALKIFLSTMFSFLIGIIFYKTGKISLLPFFIYYVLLTLFLSISILNFNSYKKFLKKNNEYIENAKIQIEIQENISAELLKERNQLEIKVKDRTKELTEANEKLMELDLLKTNFFANITHELRTPLTLILSPIKEIKKGTYGEKIDKTNQVFTVMEQNASRLLRLINNILNTTKIDEGKMTLKKEKISISNALKVYVSQIESAVKNKNLHIKLNDNTNGITAVVDQNLFEIVVFNILSNAIKFTSQGGILINLEKQNHDNFIISISDTGIGIPENKLEYIFERFHQIDENGTRKYEGSGIGLSLVKEIIELHNGKIFVESKEGYGSTFKIILPIDKDKSIESEKTAKIKQINPIILDEFIIMKEKQIDEKVSNYPAKKTILIVEDNRDLQKYIYSILDKKYNIEIAFNGKEGLEKINNIRKPSLIVSDIMMPEMDGNEFFLKIQEIEEYKDIPFIFLTARAGQQEIIKGLKKGAYDYICKPFDADELSAKIDNFVEKTEKIKENFKKKIGDKILSFLSDEVQHVELSNAKVEIKLRGYNLSYREKEIIQFFLKGNEIKLIADKLNIKQHTVENNLSNIYKKIGVSNKIELFNFFHNE